MDLNTYVLPQLEIFPFLFLLEHVYIVLRNHTTVHTNSTVQGCICMHSCESLLQLGISRLLLGTSW